jgi:ribosomal subunit interface protein
MIKKLEISGVHTELTSDLKKYVIKKIGRLDSYMPRHSRESVKVEVTLKEGNAKDKNRCECEVVMRLPQETVAVKEATVNMFAAVDIVEAKLRNQLKKYKETHSKIKLHRRLMARLRRRSLPEAEVIFE